MAQLNSVVKEIIQLLKKTSFGKNKKMSLWGMLNEHAEQEGTWDPDLISEIEKKIAKHISTIREDDLRMMWESTEAGIESFDDRNDIPLNKINSDLVNELMNHIMDNLDSSGNFDDDMISSKLLDDDFEDEFGIDDPGGFEDDYI